MSVQHFQNILKKKLKHLLEQQIVNNKLKSGGRSTTRKELTNFFIDDFNLCKSKEKEEAIPELIRQIVVEGKRYTMVYHNQLRVFRGFFIFGKCIP